MPSSQTDRKLAAIMFTDIAGYTESMSKSESKSLDTLEKKRSILNPLLKEYKGTFVKEIGDGTLSYFESAVNAATCAVKLQENSYNDKDMNIRVGIHIGDIVFKDGDVFGGGVNVASRLESIAPAGGVCVSKSVYDELSNQDEFDGIELGLQSLKGVGRLIEVFGLKGDKLNEPDPQKYQENKVTVHSDDEVPSIAIIPFENKGADEDVFYAYGISADLISDCSGAGLIRVAGLKDIEKLDYTNLKYEELSKKLLVRYIAQGTLWKMDDEFQLSVELYDTKDKKIVWSDRWQEKWDNLPTIKGSLSDGLLKALDTKPKVEKNIESDNAEAYELYLRAKYAYKNRKGEEDIFITRDLLNQAIILDDSLRVAKHLLGITYANMGTSDDNKMALKIYMDNLEKAEKSNDKKAMSSALHMIAYTICLDDIDKAHEYNLRSLKISQELGNKEMELRTINNIGNYYREKENYSEALKYYLRSKEMCEELEDIYSLGFPKWNIGCIYFRSIQYDKALKVLNKTLLESEKSNNREIIARASASIGQILCYIGNYDEAIEKFNLSLIVRNELGFKPHIEFINYWIGRSYYHKSNYEKSDEYFNRCINIQKEIGDTCAEDTLDYAIHLELMCKMKGTSYNKTEIITLIKEVPNPDLYLNFRVYQLLEDTSYLEIAYSKVQERADKLEPDVRTKFLSYPIPKAIVEEWEKVK